MKLVAKVIAILLLIIGFSTEGAFASQSAYAKTRRYICEATLYGVDYDIQAYVGKRYHCKPIWDEMYREEMLSFN